MQQDFSTGENENLGISWRKKLYKRKFKKVNEEYNQVETRRKLRQFIYLMQKRKHVSSHPMIQDQGLEARNTMKMQIKTKLPSLFLESMVQNSKSNLLQFESQKESMISLPGTISISQMQLILAKGIGFPALICNHVISFLIIRELPSVTAVSCSSSSMQHPLSEALTRDNSTWWISGGCAPQHIEFEINGPPQATLLQIVGITIPPLPQGPLSVRTFSIAYTDRASQSPDGFIENSIIYETVNTAQLQLFLVDPPILITPSKRYPKPRLRIICKSTAAENAPCVGFFYAQFS